MNSDYVRTTTQISKNDYESLREIAFKRKISIAKLFREAIKNLIKKDLTP